MEDRFLWSKLYRGFLGDKMTWALRLIVGSKAGRIVALVLVAGLISFATIQWHQNTIRNQVLQEQRIEQFQRQQQTRDRVDEGIRNTPGNIDDIREWLRNRQSSK